MWELDPKEGWVPKNWCFRTVVLEKTLESALDCKEIKPVNPIGNQPWIFTGKTDAEANPRRQWRTGKPGMLQSIGSQRFGHDLLTDWITTTNPHSISSCFRGTKAQEVKSGSISHSVMSNSLQPLWTVARQAPLFMGFPRQEYWSGLPFPSQGNGIFLTQVSCGHRKIHFSIFKCFGKLFQVTVSSSQAQWQGKKEGKKEEKVPLWGRESCPNGVACQPSERVELRAWTQPESTMETSVGRVFARLPAHTLPRRSALGLADCESVKWRSVVQGLIFCLRVLPLHYY